jgi:hypothetical protein
MDFRRDSQRFFGGTAFHRLVQTDGGLKIAWKRVDLVNCDAPMDGITIRFDRSGAGGTMQGGAGALPGRTNRESCSVMDQTSRGERPIDLSGGQPAGFSQGST